jgi:hypothetical protein
MKVSVCVCVCVCVQNSKKKENQAETEGGHSRHSVVVFTMQMTLNASLQDVPASIEDVGFEGLIQVKG